MWRISFSLLAVLATLGCNGSDVVEPPNRDVGPGASAVRAAVDVSSSESSTRGGPLHITKDCSENTGLAGSFCTITSSNVKEIEPGTRVIYASAKGPTTLDSDVTLDPPG